MGANVGNHNPHPFGVWPRDGREYIATIHTLTAAPQGHKIQYHIPSLPWNWPQNSTGMLPLIHFVHSGGYLSTFLLCALENLGTFVTGMNYSNSQIVALCMHCMQGTVDCSNLGVVEPRSFSWCCFVVVSISCSCTSQFPALWLDPAEIWLWNLCQWAVNEHCWSRRCGVLSGLHGSPLFPVNEQILSITISKPSTCS